MKINYFILILTMSLTLPVHAQNGTDYHPFLTDTFIMGAGLFFPKHGLELSADGTRPGEDIDFDGSLGVDDSSTTGAASLRWNFSEKWSLWGQWWETDSSGSQVLEEDVTWNDIEFLAGSSVGAGVKLSVVRIFLGREFWSGPQYEFGAGVGVHWMKVRAFIEGEAITPDETTGFKRSESDLSIPLPNIGAWYYYSPSAKWLLSASVDWLSASIGDYSGSLWDIQAGVNYQLSEHFGLGLSYQYFKLDGDVDDTDWRGSMNLHNNGPLLALTANWSLVAHSSAPVEGACYI